MQENIESLNLRIETLSNRLSSEKDPAQKENLEISLMLLIDRLERATKREKNRGRVKDIQQQRVGRVTKLGTFEVTGDELRVTDPCYSKDTTGCAGTLENPAKGTWHAYIQYQDEGPDWGVRNSTIFAVHESCSQKLKFEQGWLYKNHMSSLSGIDVGVDSGTAGIFDDSKYPDNPHEEREDDDQGFYYRCGVQTIGDGISSRFNDDGIDTLGAGVVAEGCVTRSGDGDGSYRCFYESNDNGEVDAVEISFYYREDEMEDEEDFE